MEVNHAFAFILVEDDNDDSWHILDAEDRRRA